MLDLLMPGIDGLELMEQAPELGDLPVIFISGCGRDERIVRSLEAGTAYYTVKPLSLSMATEDVQISIAANS